MKRLYKYYEVQNNRPQPIAQKARMAWPEMAFIQLGFLLALRNLLTGVWVAQNLSDYQGFRAILIGNFIVFILVVFYGLMGRRIGIPITLLARFSLGKKGSRILSFFLSLFACGWAAIGLGLMARALGPYVNLSQGLLIFLLGLVFSILILRVFPWSTKIPLLSSFVLGVFTLYSLYVSLTSNILQPSQWKMADLSGSASLPGAIAVVVGTWMVMALASPELYRYARRPRDIIGSAFLGLMIFSSLQMFVAGILANLFSTYQVTQLMAKLGLGWLGLVFILLTAYALSDHQVYAGGVTLARFLGLRKRMPAFVLIIVAAVLLALGGIVDHYQAFLSLMALVSLSLTGLIFTHDGLVLTGFIRHAYYYEGIRYKGLLAWILGVLLAGLKGGPYDFLYGFLISSLAYLVIIILTPKERIELDDSNIKQDKK